MRLPRTVAIAVTLVLGLAGLTGCSADPRIATAASPSTPAPTTPDRDWPRYGLNASETRFSPLKEINRSTVGRLGLISSRTLPTRFSLQATPIMIKDTLYFTGDFSEVFAVDAVSGETRWHYRPDFDRSYLRRSTYGTANRGVAVENGRLFVGTLNGELHALDQHDGRLLWTADTRTTTAFNYTITGAPRLAGDLVLIGNAGAEFGVRGYVSAYDQRTGELRWRFFTVPGDPALPHEHEALKIARPTWTGDRYWKFGGGGTVWNSIVYDEDLDQVYLGVGNGSPLARAIRSPGGGDNLFLSSIVALDAATGTLRWYYQTTPADNWDYTATQDMALTTLKVDGIERPVLLQAPKNGFFYLLDRRNGELLRAHPYVKTTWATHVDMNTGRPVENPEASFNEQARRVWPGPLGGHNWQAMAFDRERRLAFLPSMENPGIYSLDPGFKATGQFPRNETTMNIGFGPGATDHLPPAPPGYGQLQAFDPVTGKTRWRVRHAHYFNGGVLATAGGLVFQGDAMGYLSAYDADSGERLWRFNSYRSILAPPITYRLEGHQYLAILTATGGGEHYAGYIRDTAAIRYGNRGQLLIFSLDGTQTLTEPPRRNRTVPAKPEPSLNSGDLARGNGLYHQYCANCHGANARSAGVYPDLVLMPAAKHALFDAIVRGGLLETNGMASFADTLAERDVELIEGYLLHRAAEDRRAQLDVPAQSRP